jgi:hypothetical protein
MVENPAMGSLQLLYGLQNGPIVPPEPALYEIIADVTFNFFITEYDNYFSADDDKVG